MNKYVPNKRGLLEVALLIGPVQEALGKAVVERANANNPTDRFRFEHLASGRDGADIVVTVGTDYPFAHLIEWGSVQNQPYAPLRKAVTGLGLKFEED